MVKNLANTIRGVDKQYLASGFLSLGSNHLAGVLIALLTSYFFANYLSKGVYGNYQFVLTILGVMSIFTLRGVGKQIIREYVQTGKSILVPKTKQFILYALPVSGIGLITSIYFYFKQNTELAISLSIISLSFPLLNGLLFYSTHLLAKEDFRKKAILGVIQNAIPAISLISMILLGAGLTELILTYCISHIVTLGCLYTYTVRTYQIPLRESASRTSSEVHLSLGQSILEIGKISDKLITFSFLGAAPFASYMIALLPVRELMRIPQILRSLLLPKFSQHNYKQVRAHIYGKTFILLILFSSIAALYSICAPYLFSILFPQYIDSVFLTQLMSLLLPLTSGIGIVQMLTIFDRTKNLYLVNTVYSTGNIVLLILLIPLYGLVGAVIAKLIASSIKLAMLIFISWNDVNQN